MKEEKIKPNSVELYLVEKLLSSHANEEMIKTYLKMLPKDRVIKFLVEYFKTKEDTPQIIIPISVLSEKSLSPLEAIVKYLKEELTLSNARIAKLLGRTPQNIWITYRNSKKKSTRKSIVTPSEYDFPLDILNNEELSVMEAIVTYLRTSFELTFKEISTLIKRNERTIWTINHRARKQNKIKTKKERT